MRVSDISGAVVAELCELGGVEVAELEREADGRWSAHLVTAAGVVACCPGCGAPAERVKEAGGQRLVHLVVVPMALTWHKRRFSCENGACDRDSFTEDGPVASRGARVSTPGRETIGHLCGDWLVAVSRLADTLGISWHTAHEAFVRLAETAGIVVTDPGEGVPPAAPPEHPEHPEPGEPAGREERAGAVAAACSICARPPRRVRRSVSGPLPLVGVLGIDDHRRGRALYHRDAALNRWVEDADRWQTVFVDSSGSGGLLGQTEYRTAAATTAWLEAQPPAWRANVWAVTTDMSTVYKGAVRGALPHAVHAVDPFHVIQLANRAIGDVRRRIIFARYGRRGRAADPEYRYRTLPLRNLESLSEAARGRLRCLLADLGDAGRQLAAAHTAKELLRAVCALAPTHTGRPTTRAQISTALTRFFTHCATVGETVPEVVTLAETISSWREEIGNTVLHGLSNATAEGVNRLIKLVYPSAFGLTNVANQQRRARHAASRLSRPLWLRTATTSEHTR